MLLCSHCGHENRAGSIYCERCGVALVPIPLSTRKLEDGDVGGSTDQLGADGVVILQVENDETPILVQMRREVVLGRVTETDNEERTYINLLPYGADEAGVSRRHVRLLREGRAVYALDLNSTNGTHVNGEPLQPGVERRLRDGDELVLGRLKLYIYFKP